MTRTMRTLFGAGVIAMSFSLWPWGAHAELLNAGDVAPNFDTQMVVGEELRSIKLTDLLGKKVVLYFYPKDMTPGCTKEACAFRDGYAKFAAAGIAVLGCSVDSIDAHKAFIRKYQLPFPLLLDPDKKIAKAYGAADGIPILGLDRRVTYIIDENGKIGTVYPKVDPALHAREIIKALGADQPIVTIAPGPASAAKAGESETKATRRSEQDR